MSAQQSRRVAVGAAVLLLAVIVAVLWYRPRAKPHSRPAPFSWATLDRNLRMAWAGSLAGDGTSWASMDRQGLAPTSATASCGRTEASARDATGGEAAASSASAPAASEVTPSWPGIGRLPGPTLAEQRVIDAMRQSPDAFDQAAALVLGPSGDPDDPIERRERLAMAAVRTSDPRIYALAYSVCSAPSASSPPGTCALLTTAQWARLDADNGMPWLYTIGQAVQHGDVAARDEALFHLSVASRIDDRFFDIPASVTDRSPPGDDAATLAAFGLSVRGSSAMSNPPLQPLIDLCKGPQLGDSNRRQLCVSVANTLIDHGSSLILQSIGATVDTNVTGNADRANRLRAERDALLASPDSDDSCSGIRRRQRRLQRSAQIGELAAWREGRSATPP